MSSAQSPRPSHEELAALVAELKLVISAQAATITQQTEETAELKRQVSTPRREAPVADPDTVVDHHPAACGDYEHILNSHQDVGYRARQVFDLPEITPQVMEHRLHQTRCDCGYLTTASAQERVRAATVHGPGVRAAGADALDPDVLSALQERYRQAVLCGIAAHPYAGTGPKSKTQALAERLRDRAGEYQRFMVDFRVPFDNNTAERDLRMIKIQQKISGSWRTLTGARRFARIRSYLSTVRKHGLNPMTVLRDLFAGRPWILPTTN